MEGYLFTPHPRSSETCLQGRGVEHFFFFFQTRFVQEILAKNVRKQDRLFFTELKLKLRQSIELGTDLWSIVELTTCARAPIRLTSTTDRTLELTKRIVASGERVIMIALNDLFYSRLRECRILS